MAQRRTALPYAGRLCVHLHRPRAPHRGYRRRSCARLVETQGHSATYRIGDALVRAGSERCLRRPPTGRRGYIRVMILARALIAQKLDQYVTPNTKEKTKSQQYRLFVDAPLTWR